MIKKGPYPHFIASNYNIFEAINFETYEILPRWEQWLPFPMFMANANRPIVEIAWHSRYPTLHPHSYQYRLLRSLTNNDLQEVTKVLQKMQKMNPNFINQPIDKHYNYTALQYASVTNNYPAIDLLLMYGANINLPDQQGNTPLMLAVLNQSLQSINSLMKSGCDWRLSNMYGIDPQRKAKQMKKEFISDFIQEYADRLLEKQKSKKNKKKQVDIQSLVIKRKFPRFRAQLDIEKCTNSPFWNFIANYKIDKPKVVKNPFNNFSGDYRISFNSFEA